MVFPGGLLTHAGYTDDLSWDEGRIFSLSSDKMVRSLWGGLTIDEMLKTVPTYESDGDSGFWIVQFEWPMYSSYRDSLEDLGCGVLSYMPDDSYIVHRGDVDPGDITSLPGVVGISPYISGLKLSPETYDVLFNDDPVMEIGEADTLQVELFLPDEEVRTDIDMVLDHPVVGSDIVYTLQLPISDPEGLLSIDGIRWIEPSPVYELHNNVSQGIMGVEEVWQTYGLNGTGQMVTIADTGLDTGVDDHNVTGDIHLDFDNRVTLANWAGTSPDDGHSHGTHVTGSVAGNGRESNGTIRGMAYNASIFFQAIMADGGSLQIPSNLSLLFQQSYENGSRIHTNSWGSSVAGAYTTSSQWVDWFQYHNPEMLILFSAGNSGIDWYPEDGKVDGDSIGAPATAKNCLTVGASENYRLDTEYDIYKWGDWSGWKYYTVGGWKYVSKYPYDPVHSDKLSDDMNGLAAFSSRGPTDDGRIKPDVVAPGTEILSCNSSIAGSGNGWGLYQHNDKYLFMGGTSMSCPLTAGMAVLVRQYFTDVENLFSPSGALVKAAMINGAVDMTPGQYSVYNATTKEVNSRPDFDQGWGRVNLTTTISPYNGGKLGFIDEKTGIQTSDSVVRYFRVNSNEEIRLTLAWSDFPAAPYATKTLVNDLDLILISPNGTRYHGNDFLRPFDDTRDDVNNVEGISISDPATGWWKVIINGTSVPMGPQHFAVVISGNISDPVTSGIYLDREYYSTDGDMVTVEIVNKDLAGTGSVSATISSNTNTTGRTIRLNETRIEGSFLGYVMASNVSTSNSSRLHVGNNDTINASYTYVTLYSAYAKAKTPQRIFIARGPEMYQVFSEYSNMSITGTGDPGIKGYWGISNITMSILPLLDDGNLSMGDLTADDGNYSYRWVVLSGITGSFDLIVMVEDTYLGQRAYPQFTIEFNHSVPRVPVGVSLMPDPLGNGVMISWYGTNETDMDHHSIYVNSTPPLLWEADGWDFVVNTTGLESSIGISGLTDGVEYLLRVSAVDTSGYESTPSVWMNVTPMDTTPPNVDLLTTSYTIVGIAELEFVGDPDLDRVEVEYFNDTDNNGIADDTGEEYHPAATGPPVGFEWDTRSEAGGPGDVPHMIIRYRGYDEVNNTSTWREASGFSVDNTGPDSVSIIGPPPRITDQETWVVEGLSEPLGWTVVKVNGEEQSNNTVGGSGRFDIYLVLEEGYNEVLLEAYDKHGAGPTNRTYEITLDTLLPVPVIDVGSSMIEREISLEGTRFNSTSYDVGLDPDFTRVDNTSWRVIDPEGGIVFDGFGISVLIPFDSIGSHTVNLTVRDPAGNENNTIISVNITDTTPPVVNFTGPEIADEDHSVQYTADGTIDNDPSFDSRPLTSYLWFFEGRGWNSTYHGHTIWIDFPHPGVYNATLRVTDGGGNTGQGTKKVTVLDHTPPAGSIDGPFAVYLGQPVEYLPNFTDNGEGFPEGAYFRWNLTYYTGAEVEWWVSREGFGFPFNFTEKGFYTLELMVRDRSGNSVNRSVGIDAYGDLTAPTVVSIYPVPNGTIQYSEDLKVTITFSEEVDQDTLAGSVWFEDITNGSPSRVETVIEIVDGERIRVSSPGFELGHTYRVVVSRGIKDGWGNALTIEESRNYTVRSRFSLVFPDGVHPIGIEVNFSVGEDIVLRFTNPVRLTSLLNHLRIWAVPTDEGDGGFEVSFEVEAGEDEFTAIIRADLDMGLTYNVSLDHTLRDIYDFKLDKDYQWDFKTYKPYIPQNETPVTDDDEGGGGEEGINLDQYVPHLLILIAIVLCMIIIFSVISRTLRRRKMNRIWEQTGDAPDRSRGDDEVDDAPYPGDGPLPVDGDPVVGDTVTSPSPPDHEDLYGSPPPVGSERTEPIGPVMGASDEFGIGDEGIRWDDEERSDWDDDDESDWEE